MTLAHQGFGGGPLAAGRPSARGRYRLRIERAWSVVAGCGSLGFDCDVVAVVAFCCGRDILPCRGVAPSSDPNLLGLDSQHFRSCSCSERSSPCLRCANTMNTVKRFAKYSAAVAVIGLCAACAASSLTAVRDSGSQGEFVVLDASDPECSQIRDRPTTAHPITSRGRVVYGWISGIKPGEKIDLTVGSSTMTSEWSRYEFHQFSKHSYDLNADGSFIVYLNNFATLSLLIVAPSEHRVVTILMTTRELCVGIPLKH
jgi:hypothetical protein